MVGILKATGVALLLLFTTLATSEPLEEDEPQLQYNASLFPAEPGILNSRDTSGLNLFARASYYTCPSGYGSCNALSTRCCPSEDLCCSNGYCAKPGAKCCTIGTCPSGWNCCGNAGRCSPVDGECCSNGYHCKAGYHCRSRNGRIVCCPASGCVGEVDSGRIGNTVSADEATSITQEATTATATATITRVRYSYYYTTYYWTYWWYFWTTYSPYTAKTVTSTRTSTRTIWSAYETASADAEASFSRSIESYTFSTPYSATALMSSADPVTIVTRTTSSSSTEPTETSTSSSSSAETETQLRAGGDSTDIPDSANAVIPSGLMTWTCIVVAVAMGGLAVGL